MAKRDKTLTVRGHSRRRTKKQLVVFFAVFALVVFAVLGFFIARRVLNANPDQPSEEQFFTQLEISTAPVTENERDEYTVSAERPRYIYIPAAGVDKARVIATGVKAPGKDNKQQLDVPKNLDDVGWYDCQINPLADKRCSAPTLPGGGATGAAALMTGHTCFSRTLKCVFDNISKLKNGDVITIERGDGKKLDYKVKKVEIVKLADVDMAKAMRSIESGKEGLTLITCTGTYRGTTDANGVATADKRVLVYATLQ